MNEERLKKAVATRLRTTMIGSISAVEEVFGFLWGHGRPEAGLTEREREMDVLREELRTRILNLGNGQLRSLISEIERTEA